MEGPRSGRTTAAGELSGQSNGQCVEVADLRNGVAVRDSKDKSGPALAFDAQGWCSFINSLKSN
ncbi:DUF397 domain-containing protein [Micromonospora sp. RTGN7]|uniref:DUF397 domain-containing protein n=1 Tax=Micromonospora sp. RTGN7 TaxID=3016526 RepID=UPI0029FEECCE|nr:DUF397 domain-containing protein [Micromonospora sp. RTGN7]